MTLRLHKDFFNFPSGCLKKSHPIADYAPRPADFLGSQRKKMSSFRKEAILMHAANNKDYQEGYQACVAYLYEQYREENLLSTLLGKIMQNA